MPILPIVANCKPAGKDSFVQSPPSGTVFLQTKLLVPPPRPALVNRPHLIETLNLGLRGKLTLISAPAGFGKTTLVTAWIQSHDRSTAWLSLDEQDSQPVRFLTYLVAAIQTVLPTIGIDLMAALQSPQPPPVTTSLAILLNEISAAEDKFLLVLDDYHLVDSPAVDQALAFLLDHLPPQLHLVMTTREDPQLPLPRLRGRHQLTELRAADLRFTLEETAAFLNQIMDLNLSADDVASLETRTEGWIAGLQLAALALHSQPSGDPQKSQTQFIQTLAGDNRYIVDYLIAEVLQNQPPHIRTFLLQTAILNRLSGPLCDAVTGQSQSALLLETLERSNLFVISLDDKRRWYRYHHLFADVLHLYLLREQPDVVDTLHQRASRWYEHNDQPAEAIRHALIAEDYDRAAGLIEGVWPALLHGFRPVTWRNWVQALPDALVNVRPVLNVGCAWTLLDDGELESAEAYLITAERLLDDSLGQMVVVNKTAFATLPASIASARAYLAQARGQVATAVQKARLALHLFPEDESYQRGIASLFLGLAYWTEGKLAAAYDAITASVASMRLANNVYFQSLGTAFLADLKMALGFLHEAARLYEQSLQLVREPGGFTLQETADQYIGLSALHREWDDLETAVSYLQKAQHGLSQMAILPGSATRWHIAQAQIKTAEGDLDGALDQLHTAERLFKRDPIPDMRPVAAQKARIWLRQGSVAAAVVWADDHGLSADDELSYLREFEHLTLVRIWLAEGQPDAIKQAERLLSRLQQAAEAEGRGRSVIEILILQALARQAQGDLEGATAVLDQALTLAEPERYVRLFVDEGAAIRPLLAACLTRGAASEYTTRLMQAIDPTPDTDAAPPDPNQLLIEPLSEREIEVLALLGDGMTNQAIADELVIALSTVKKHVNNILGKLHVGNRTQAVSRAQALNIL